ncbi:conserved unknown protein [Ectocarpus siliculosus]|uniref:Bromo domain-containing protein n=1 Tax=Ectocarpus siliculosus TaxID=2880 RepID=D7FQF0_ECTSI|nr:conserved unknown protein [Ectocarpus siliculosus]|eukprot:CBJ48482.1 conserved unknown protein [Ectocarpus siliculosus]
MFGRSGWIWQRVRRWVRLRWRLSPPRLLRTLSGLPYRGTRFGSSHSLRRVAGVPRSCATRLIDKAFRCEAWRTCPTRCSCVEAISKLRKPWRPGFPTCQGQRCRLTSSGFTQSLASGDGKGTNGSRSSGGGGGGDKAPSRRGPVSRTGGGEAGTVVASARGVASSGRAAREGSGGQQVTGTGANGGGAGQPKASGNGNSKTSARKKKNRTAGAAPSAATSSGSSATVAAACEAFASAAPRTGGGLGGGAAAAAVAAAGGRQGDTMPGVTPIMSPVTSSGRAPGLWTTLKKMWSEVNKHRSSWAFRKGVDPTMAPGYLDVVKHPIDLEGIRKRLDGPVVHYTSKAMLQDDLELMCRNAMLYNDEGTEYHRVAEDLLRFIESMFIR